MIAGEVWLILSTVSGQRSCAFFCRANKHVLLTDAFICFAFHGGIYMCNVVAAICATDVANGGWMRLAWPQHR